MRFFMDKERDCENCIHYVANYELKLKTCEKWSCQFEKKKEKSDENI